MIEDGQFTYTWDGENRLIGVAPASSPVNGDKKLAFKYDYMNRRVEKMVWTYNGGWGSPTQVLRFVYDQWNVVLVLDATDEENGAVEVFPRLHRMELPASAEDPRDVDPAGVRGVTPVVVGTRGGDVLLLHPMAPHRSGPNRSRGSRRLVTYVFTTTRHADAGARYYAAHPARG